MMEKFIVKKHEKVADKDTVVEERTMTFVEILEKMFNMINDNIEKNGWTFESHYTVELSK